MGDDCRGLNAHSTLSVLVMVTATALPRGAGAISRYGWVGLVHALRHPEKCQFRTEKCQFETEECQFETEKCHAWVGAGQRRRHWSTAGDLLPRTPPLQSLSAVWIVYG